MTLAPLLAVPLAALASLLLVLALRPLLARYALARPNARSSHRVPTPQGGGIPVVGAAGLAVAVLGPVPAAGLELPVLAGATLALALVGAVDDIRPLPALPRLGLQALCVAAVVGAAGGQLVPEAPLWLERGLAVVAGLWFVNLVNFMDGLDWMTCAEMVPLTGAALLIGLFGGLPPAVPLVAAALLGGLLGFAPFNRPVARLFLGDVGSLPIGLLAAWLLYRMALAGGLAAAILLPLYYLADATLTLARRLAAGERVFEAHRTHFYQRATTNGLAVADVVGRVFRLNLALAGLAAATLAWPGWPTGLGALALGALLVAHRLHDFARPRPHAAVAA
jgi:UDP-N-acetylmuramyl pentapeptide phosphotransferase/UDP-N-acetylglucosamine-1-phosphate transferase